MSDVEIKVFYTAKAVIGGFVGEAGGTIRHGSNEGPLRYTFDTVFDSREAAAADAKARLVEAFSAGTYRGP